MEIVIYTFCVMYSPGPVNLLAFNGGVQRQGLTLAGYAAGVGAAMFTGFVVLGTLGSAVVNDAILPYIALAGSGYILYLAYRMFRAPVCPDTPCSARVRLRVRDGYLLQLLNPKGLVVILPVTTLMLPAAAIHGSALVVVVALISIGAVGAPAAYALFGTAVGRRWRDKRMLGRLNRIMAVLLVLVACSIVYDFFLTGAVYPA
ncbi:LysE family transporter [Salinisphaera sp. T31B1]|uniref:LysE family translocator n=1 Tax=Salinisphaera sp. T31B1 TaxID=727963 RepID=UPI00334082F9